MELQTGNTDAQKLPKQEFLRHNNTTLYRGDSTNPNLFDAPFIDLIVTSPPYIDDSLVQKAHTDENAMITWHWDHRKRAFVKGINFLSLLYY